ncbi:MAG: zinc ABC transporter substrate-binding protein [Desulfurococcaceae archaeon]
MVELKAIVNAVALALVVLAIITQQALSQVVIEEGLNIVVTFTYLGFDVEQLVCIGDRVIALVPSGVDPHEYQLTPSDVDVLRNADLIISTAHAPFELKIRELVNSGDVSSSLIEAPYIDGVKTLVNPSTGSLNLHAVTYDPHNYAVFLTKLAEEMSIHRPSCRDVYYSKLSQVLVKLVELTSSVRKVSGLAIGESPLTQYAVEWLGIEVKSFALIEHELMAPPSVLKEIEDSVKRGVVDYILVIEGSSSVAHSYLLELAEKYNRTVLRIPSPLAEGSTLSKLAKVVEQVNEVSQLAESCSIALQQPEELYELRDVVAVVLVTAVATAAAVLTADRYLVRRVGRK